MPESRRRGERGVRTHRDTGGGWPTRLEAVRVRGRGGVNDGLGAPSPHLQHLTSNLQETRDWWARQDLNLRATGYEPGALPLSYGPAPG